MFVNSHSRLAIPAALGTVMILSKIGPSDPGGAVYTQFDGPGADVGNLMPMNAGLFNDDVNAVTLHFDSSKDGTNFVNDGAGTSVVLQPGGTAQVPLTTGFQAIKIRASAASPSVIDATFQYRHTGVQQ